MLSALKPTSKNPLIAKKQAALTKSFTSWKKASALADANDLAWFLYATGNTKAARSIVDEIADNVVFAKHYDPWWQAANAICLGARIAREAKDAKRYKQLIARVVEVPAYAEGAPRKFFDKLIASNVDEIVDARTQKRAATACDYAADALHTLVYFAETVRHGGVPYPWMKVAELERAMAEALTVLRERL